MSHSRQSKQQQQQVVQYLDEAHAMEHALVRVLQSQIAMTPRGAYRSGLERRLDETRDHAARVGRRLQEFGDGSNPVMAVVGAVETVLGRRWRWARRRWISCAAPAARKVLKNAKDACATEALEIATYTALERLAQAVGDEETARLAASIRADEEMMLERVLRELPKLMDAVVGADIDRITALRGDEPWPGYDELTAAEVQAVLSEGDDERAKQVRSYERAHKNRAGVLDAAEREHSNA